MALFPIVTNHAEFFMWLTDGIASRVTPPPPPPLDELTELKWHNPSETETEIVLWTALLTPSEQHFVISTLTTL